MQAGDPAKALALVEQLVGTKKMGPVDRRCMLALRIAVRAIVKLRAIGLPPLLDLQHFIGVLPGFALERRHVPALQSVIAAEAKARIATPLACPNCGSAGAEIGWVHPVRGSGVPYGRFYFDSDAIFAAAVPGEQIDPVHAHLLVTLALALLEVRVPVLGCKGCGLRYVSWRRDEAADDQYAAPPGGSFDVNGKPAYGRANVLTFAYDKVALPLHLEGLFGDLRGRSVY